MDRLLNKPIVAVLGGLFLTAPFIVLEWINTSGFWSLGIPPLFFIMWLSGGIFTYTLGLALRDLLGKKTKANPVFLIAKVALLILMAWIFVGLVIDQWPCFMGVPNCD